MHISSKSFSLLFILLATCLFSRPVEAGHGEGSEITSSSQTAKYTFLPKQSTLIQTGGIAGVHWTYSVEGHFVLTVNFNAGTASFVYVDANGTDDSPYRRTLDPNKVFNMTSLIATVLGNMVIEFTGKTADASNVIVTATIEDDLAYLVGQTIPPPDSADFFIFSLDAVAKRKYGGGTGEPNDPYQIATADDLMLLGDSPEDYGKHFILTADIDLDPNLPSRKVFDKAIIAPDMNDTESGFQGTSFTGAFDGNGHKIWNFNYNSNDTYNIGLFGYIDDDKTQVKNLSLIDPNIDAATAGSVGALVGHLGEGSISGCHVFGGTVSGGSSVGGLVGYIHWGTVTECSSTAAVTGFSTVGGLVGKNYGGSIENSYSTGTITGELSVGGLVGSNMGFADIVNCYAMGDVTGNRNVAGIAGHNSCRQPRLGTIECCYSIGRINGSEYVGSIVGWNCGAVVSSFWDIQTSGMNEPNYGEGRTTAQMQTAKTFLDAGWDFVGETANGAEDIWAICEGTNYPRFVWQILAGDFVCPDGITIEDFVFFIEHWGESCDLSNDYCQGTDLDQSGKVDVGDLEVFLENWLAGSW